MGLTISLPWHVDEECSSDVNTLVSHGLEIIQTTLVHQTHGISTRAQLRLSPVVLVLEPEEVIVARVSVDPLVEQERVARQGLREGSARPGATSYAVQTYTPIGR